MGRKMTSRPSWRSSLSQAYNALGGQGTSGRVAFVGVGNVLLADDAIGVDVARALQPHFAGCDEALVIDAGVAPENQTGPLRAFQPDLVVFIDAADLGEPAGSICWLDWRETVGMSASTHTLPLHVLAEFLTADLGCQVALIGIQVTSVGFETPIGDELVSSVSEIVAGIVKIILS